MLGDIPLHSAVEYRDDRSDEDFEDASHTSLAQIVSRLEAEGDE
jgi:hypothetical protein